MVFDCRNEHSIARCFRPPGRIRRAWLAAICASFALFSAGTAMAERRSSANEVPAAAAIQASNAGDDAFDRNDFATALRQFTIACDGRVADGCLNLGGSYAQGTGVARNIATAVSYYVRPCDAGNGNGCYNAGIYYHSGDGVAQSYDLAIGYFRRALVINPNDKDAQADLASAQRHRPARQ